MGLPETHLYKGLQGCNNCISQDKNENHVGGFLTFVPISPSEGGRTAQAAKLPLRRKKNSRLPPG